MKLAILMAVVLLAGCATESREAVMERMTLAPSVALLINDDTYGSGTVVKVTEEGAYILTNYHVISNAKSIIVQFYHRRGEEFKAEVYSSEPTKDIAVIFAPHMCSYVATLGSPDDVRLFRESICIGSSSGYPLAPSRGIITQIDFDRHGQLMYRSDCNITFGNSGGGLFVEVGREWRLVGMPTAVHSHSFFGNRAPVPFLGFMVTINDILEHFANNPML